MSSTQARPRSRPAANRRLRHPEVLTTAPAASLPPSAIFNSRATRIGLFAVFLAALVIYAVCCARTVTGEDSGELIAAAYTLGVAHPPGYPLWCVLGKLASLVPVGEVAFRVAMLSAVFGAATVALIAATVLLLSRSWPAAVSAGFGFGLMRDQWSQAVIAEVYTLNTFFLVLCTLLLFIWSERRSWPHFHAFALCFGLSLTNHPTMLAAAPPFLLFLLIKGWRLLREWRRLLVAAGLFLFGLLPYLYLPLAASRNPPINWGAPTTFSAVVAHVLRRQYTEGSDPLPEQTWDRFCAQATVLFESILGQGSHAIFVLGLLALAWLLRRRFTTFLVLAGTTLMSTLVLILTLNFEPDFESSYACRLFFVPAYVALAIAGGILLGHVLRAVRAPLQLLAGIAVTICLCAVPLRANLATCDYSQYQVALAHGTRLLESVPLNAVLFPSSDHNTFPLLYLHYVLGRRPDITIGDKYGYIEPDIYRDAPFVAPVMRGRLRHSKEFRQNVERWVVETWDRPVFFSNKGSFPETATHVVATDGLWYRARPRTTNPADLRAADAAAWEATLAFPADESPTPYDYTAQMILSDLCFARARHALDLGSHDAAVLQCRAASAHAPRSKEVQNNLGSVLAEHGLHDEARPYFRRAVAIDPHYSTGARNLGISLRASDHLEEAKEVFRGLLDREPRDPIALRGMAEVCRTQNRWHEAAVYLECLGKADGDAMNFRDAGLICLFELNELKRAKDLLRVSLALDPNQPEIREVEENIKKQGGDDDRSAKRNDDKERGKSGDDPEDHANHNCAERGCDAKKRAAALSDARPRTPEVPDPRGAVMPRVDVPAAAGPNVPTLNLGPSGQSGRPAKPTTPHPARPAKGRS